VSPRPAAAGGTSAGAHLRKYKKNANKTKYSFKFLQYTKWRHVSKSSYIQMEYIIKLTLSLKGFIIRDYHLENIVYVIAITYEVITTLQFTVTHALEFSVVITSHILATDL
jgi:hypothetical protein